MMIHAGALELINFEGEYAQIPDHMQESIMNYILHRHELGSFLTGVITNNLRMAVCNADAENLPLIKLYVLWFYNVCPSNLVGEENYLNHIRGSKK